MEDRPKYEKIQPLEDFERALEEEISVSTQFGLPLCVLVAVLEGGWDPESENRAVDALRVADLVTRAGSSDLIVVLPNTGLESARTVERRLLGILPEAVVGILEFQPGDEAPALISRARQAVSG